MVSNRFTTFTMLCTPITFDRSSTWSCHRILPKLRAGVAPSAVARCVRPPRSSAYAARARGIAAFRTGNVSTFALLLLAVVFFTLKAETTQPTTFCRLFPVILHPDPAACQGKNQYFSTIAFESDSGIITS